MNIVYNRVYSGDSFKILEMDAYFKQAKVGDRILFKAENIRKLSINILNYCQKKKLIATTTKIEKNILEVEFGGNLYIKKPLNYHRRPNNATLTLIG